MGFSILFFTALFFLHRKRSVDTWQRAIVTVNNRCLFFALPSSNSSMGLTTVHPLPVKTNRSIGFFLRHPGVYSKVKRPNELSPTTVMVAGSISLLLIVSSVLALTAMHHTACVFLQHPVLRGSACAQSGNPAARPLSGMHTFHQRNTICSNPH